MILTLEVSVFRVLSSSCSDIFFIINMACFCLSLILHIVLVKDIDNYEWIAICRIHRMFKLEVH